MKAHVKIISCWCIGIEKDKTIFENNIAAFIDKIKPTAVSSINITWKTQGERYMHCIIDWCENEDNQHS